MHTTAQTATLHTARANLRRDQKSRQSSALAMGQFICGLLYIPLMWLLDIEPLMWVSIVFCGAGLVAMVAFRTRAPTQWVNTGLLVVSVACITTAAVLTGMDESPALVWLPFVPVTVTLLMGWRRAIPWAMFSWGLVLAIAFTHHAAWVPASAVPTSSLNSLMAASVLGLGAMVFGLVASYDARVQEAQLQADADARSIEHARQLAQRAHLTARMVLDQVDQGLLLVKGSGYLVAQHTRAVERIFGEVRPNERIWDLLARADQSLGAWVEACWASSLDGWMPLDLVVPQLPRQLVIGGRTISLQWRVVDSTGGQPPVALIATDISETIRAQLAERLERELSTLIMAGVEDPHHVMDFVQETDRLVAGISTEDWDPADQFRALHTLKGTVSVIGLTHLASDIHDLESALIERGALSAAEGLGLHSRWADLRARLASTLARWEAGEIFVRQRDVEQVLNMLEDGAPVEFAMDTMRRWSWSPLSLRITHLADQAQVIDPYRSGEPTQVEHACDDERMPQSPEWTRLWLSLVHVLRNSFAHGIESPEERAAAGKPRQGRIAIRATTEGLGLRISIQDDGRGVNWESLATRARKLGLLADTRSQLIEAMLSDRVSTRSEATELSGRGVGMSAVAHAVAGLSGSLSIESTPGEGCCTSIFIPDIASTNPNHIRELRSIATVTRPPSQPHWTSHHHSHESLSNPLIKAS